MKACRAVRAVKDMNETLRHITHPVLPPPSIAVTMMEGYEKDNVVPGNVRLLLDFRIHPGMDHEQVGQFLDKGFEQAGIDGFQRTLHFYMPGGEIPQDDRFVKLCLEERERQFGTVFPGKGGNPDRYLRSRRYCPGPYSGGIYLGKTGAGCREPV